MNEKVASHSTSCVTSQQLTGAGGHRNLATLRGFGSSIGTIPRVEAVEPSNGLKSGFGKLGLGLNASGSGATGKRFFKAWGCVQQKSLETPNEVQSELQSTSAVPDEAAQARTLQLKSIDEARARIFGHVIGNGERSAHKVLRRKLIGDKIVSWYPTPIQNQDPMFEDPNIKRRQLKNERLKRRGKGPPKKGHGKRAAKRAK